MTHRAASGFASVAQLMAESRGRTGLDDFGEGWQEGLEQLLQALGALAPPPHAAASAQIGALLDARLHAEHGWKTHPALLRRHISRPLIITGIVRSGTTALHKLLSMDAQFQGLEHWLAFTPMPRPPRASWTGLAAYRAIAAAHAAQLEQTPELQAEHLAAVDEVDESLLFLAQNFSSNFFGSLWHIPQYDAWQRAQDQRPDYRRLADIMRLVGGDDPRTWLLKNPGDLSAIDVILDIFPDARIVQTHRDPVQAIPSVANLILAARRTTIGPDARAQDVGPREAKVWSDALRAAHAQRLAAPDQFFDVDFRAFIADPLATVRQIYYHFDIALTAPAEAAMRGWLAAHPRQSTTLQRFSPEAFGLTEAQLKTIFAEYRARHQYH